ncbi:hypothetical protein GS501_08645 [Saccharibacter sp. 17.LH.SD]|nr:hypothetical protein [Saccharibacter sp. 17.LH.SD]
MLPFWTDCHGQKLTCTEKLRMLRENEAELRQVLQDAYDDAVLMGVDPAIMRVRFEKIVAQLTEPFP